MKKLLFIACCALTLSSCGGRKKLSEFAGMSTAEVPNLVTIRTGWLKNKKKSFDIELWITNTHSQDLVIPTSKITCSRGEVNGSFRFLRFDSTLLPLAAGEQRRIIGDCELGTKNKGEWTVTFRDIALLSDTGVAGKVLKKELALKLSPAN
ncbi:MAG: hypothetical protein R3A80_04100 [Bdellovibrionota bacterium]